ncbi:hypothetical protein RHS03_07373, partial [Rhizoctonia solani]
MLYISRAALVFAVAVLGVSAQSRSNDTDVPFGLQSPSGLTQCKNTTILWQGGKPPYKLTIKPVCSAGQNASEEVHNVSTSAGSTSLELPIRFAKDTPLIVSIVDSSNMQATAPQVTVASGDADDSCTTQTACMDVVQAPSVPVAAASTTNQFVPLLESYILQLTKKYGRLSSTDFPTDQLVTAAPSGTTVQIRSTTDSSGSTMVIVYSYATPSLDPTTITSAETSLETQSNSALSSCHPRLVILGLMSVLVTHLVLGHW